MNIYIDKSFRSCSGLHIGTLNKKIKKKRLPYKIKISILHPLLNPSVQNTVENVPIKIKPLTSNQFYAWHTMLFPALSF